MRKGRLVRVGNGGDKSETTVIICVSDYGFVLGPNERSLWNRRISCVFLIFSSLTH